MREYLARLARQASSSPTALTLGLATAWLWLAKP